MNNPFTGVVQSGMIDERIYHGQNNTPELTVTRYTITPEFATLYSDQGGACFKSVQSALSAIAVLESFVALRRNAERGK